MERMRRGRRLSSPRATATTPEARSADEATEEIPQGETAIGDIQNEEEERGSRNAPSLIYFLFTAAVAGKTP